MKVSVVITAYNVEEYIAECISSVLRQEDADIEVIVVLDAPTDKTGEIVRKLSDDDNRIKVISNDINAGAGLSRRRGIEACTGEYTLLIDGDDFLNDSTFMRRLSECAEETGADVVSGGITILKEDGSWDATSYGTCVTEGVDKVSKFWGERIVFMNNKLIRTSLYEKVPYCGRRYIEDTPVIIPILWYANKVAYVDNIGYTYRMRDTSLTHTATPLKELIYKGLCWLDLMDFFEERDKAVLDAVNVRGYISNLIQMINGTSLSCEELSLYGNDWQEFTARIFNRISITGINILEKNC